MEFFRARHMLCHDFHDTITIVASPYQIMIPSMAYERDIATQWPCFLPTNGCFSYHCCAVLLVCVTSSVVFATPKALATHMAKFLSPLRGFVAPLSGAVSTVAFRGLAHSSSACPRLRKVTPCGRKCRCAAHRKPQAGRRAAHPRPQAGRTAAQPTPQAGRRAAHPRPQAGRTAACL